MAEFKFILLFVSLHCALVAGGWWHDLFYGKKGFHAISKGQRSDNPQDSLLHTQVIVSKVVRNINEDIVDGSYCWPPTDTLDDHPPIVITMFEAFDMDTGSKGGEAFEESGGVGKNQVCVYIKSVFMGSYKYKFRVYGYQRDLAAEAGLKKQDQS